MWPKALRQENDGLAALDFGQVSLFVTEDKENGVEFGKMFRYKTFILMSFSGDAA
jgi:hypothetical protein